MEYRSRQPAVVWEKACRTGLSESGLFMHDLQNMMKKPGRILGKAIHNLMLRHNLNATALSCRSRNAHMSFISPLPSPSPMELEYQFSCSSSPPHRNQKVRSRSNSYSRRSSHASPSPYHAVQGLCRDVAVSPSRFRVLRTPVQRRYSRIMDSTYQYPLMEEVDTKSKAEEEGLHIDKAAEEFIEKFYRELRLQQWLASYHYEEVPEDYYSCS